jgi:hypothetical protein
MQESSKPPKGGNGGNRATGGNGARGGKGPKASQGKSDETKDSEAPKGGQKPKASYAQHRAAKVKSAEIQISIEMSLGRSVRVGGNAVDLAQLLANMSVCERKPQPGSETGHKLDSNQKGLSRFDSQLQIVASDHLSVLDVPGCLWQSTDPMDVGLLGPFWIFIFGPPAGQADDDPAVSGKKTCARAVEFVNVHGGEMLSKARKYGAFDALHKSGKCPIDLMKKAAPRKAAAGGKVGKAVEGQCVAMSEGRGLSPEFNPPMEAAAGGGVAMSEGRGLAPEFNPPMEGGGAVQKPVKRQATKSAVFDGGDDVPSL